MEVQFSRYNHTLNYLKALACFCVLMLHCGFPGLIGKVIYGPSRFAVPIFFIISGYYIYSDDREKVLTKIPKKIKHIATLWLGTEIVYFIWHIIKSSLEYGMLEWIQSLFSMEKLLNFVIFQTTPVGDVSWFLFALLLCYLVTYFIAKNNLWFITIKLIPVLLIINIILGELIPFMGINLPWYWCSNFWVLGFPFYAIGYWIRINEKTLCEKITVRLTIVTVIVSFVVILFERVATDASQLFIGNIPCAIVLFLFCLKYPNFRFFNPYIEKIGEELSFYVYILHPIIRDIYGIVFNCIEMGNNIVVLWIRPLAVFIACIIVADIFISFRNKRNYSRTY